MIKIFIGSEPKTEIPKKVLKYSIGKHTQSKVRFYELEGETSWTKPEERQHKGAGTGFSLLRWDIPRRCDYEGFAIYLDADIICLSDIKELWEADIRYPNKECSCWCTYQPSKWFNEPTPETSVMLIDCVKAKFNQPNLDACEQYLKEDTPNRARYVKLMRCFKHKIHPQKLPNVFNSLNTWTKNTRILHYTKEDQQPWYFPQHPFRHIWEEYFKEALELEIITKEEVKEQLAKFRPHKSGIRGEGLHPFWGRYI